MKKLITIVALSLSIMFVGVSVYASCNTFGLTYGIPGTCTQAEPVANSFWFRYNHATEEYELLNAASWTVGESWCDLNTIGNTCSVTFFPE